MFANSQFRYFGRFLTSPIQFPPSIPQISTQHPPCVWKLSTQHQPVIPRTSNSVIHPLQRLWFHTKHMRVCSSMSIYRKTPQPHSPIINSRGIFLAQSLRPCWMLGGIPPSITIWGVTGGWGRPMCFGQMFASSRPIRHGISGVNSRASVSHVQV